MHIPHASACLRNVERLRCSFSATSLQVWLYELFCKNNGAMALGIISFQSRMRCTTSRSE